MLGTTALGVHSAHSALLTASAVSCLFNCYCLSTKPFRTSSTITGGSCHKYNLSRQKYACHETIMTVATKHVFLSRQKYACRNKTILCLSRQIFVMTKVLSQQNIFVATSILLSRQKSRVTKHVFVATKVLSLLVVAFFFVELLMFRSYPLGDKTLWVHCWPHTVLPTLTISEMRKLHIYFILFFCIPHSLQTFSTVEYLEGVWGGEKLEREWSCFDRLYSCSSSCC